jgi:hypothetical protein
MQRGGGVGVATGVAAQVDQSEREGVEVEIE